MNKSKTMHVFAFLICVFAMSCNSDDDNVTTPIPLNMIDVGDYNLYYRTLGTGNHTIVFESGLGDDYENWHQLLNLSDNSQLIAYNRAGYAPSETATNERSVVQLAEDLHQVILSKAQNEKEYGDRDIEEG